ncbi:MFS transporter [Achromobacter sp. UBA4530]|uniref:MFS transporter n=1 Tax=Achromobacter sp. UBA4530 TaxID=1945912 RepID=UPI00257C3468|nr:MFS transporter [Achromobacter sp. UBA4530]
MTTADIRPADPAPPSSPFAYSAFTVIWVATVLSNIGTWMHDVGAGWLMTSLSPSPMFVALVQTAGALPVFLLSLLAGALADTMDRRKLLLMVQIAMGFIALALGLVVWFGLTTPWVLLGFTLLMGIGTALSAPAWQAIVPSLVPRPSLQQAIATNSVGINVSRAIGPALAGVLITSLGVAIPFFVNAVSFIVVVAALIWWKPPAAAEKRLPREQLFHAMRAGLRFALHSKPLKSTLVRAVAFFLFASAYWALLPVIVRQVLQGGALLYGIILGCVGAGAVIGAIVLPPLRKKLGPDRSVMAGTLGTALTLVVFAVVPHPVVAGAFSFLAGASWIMVLTSLNVSAQVALPDWVRARGLAIFVTVFFGSMTAGSMIWGQTAVRAGVPTALLIAAAGSIVAMLLTRKAKLQLGADLDLAPSMHWPEPLIGQHVTHDRGPVMITVEYLIDPARGADFVQAMQHAGAERRRDGAYAWGIFEDAAHPGRYLEYFLVMSWLEHLRQHERVTHADEDQQAEVRAFHIGDTPPRVSHFVAPVPQ